MGGQGCGLRAWGGYRKLALGSWEVEGDVMELTCRLIRRNADYGCRSTTAPLGSGVLRKKGDMKRKRVRTEL